MVFGCSLCLVCCPNLPSYFLFIFPVPRFSAIIHSKNRSTVIIHAVTVIFYCLLAGEWVPCLWTPFFHPLRHTDFAKLDQETMPQPLPRASLLAVINEVNSWTKHFITVWNELCRSLGDLHDPSCQCPLKGDPYPIKPNIWDLQMESSKQQKQKRKRNEWKYKSLPYLRSPHVRSALSFPFHAPKAFCASMYKQHRHQPDDAHKVIKWCRNVYQEFLN